MKTVVVGIAANELPDAGSNLHHMSISYTPTGYVEGVRQAGGLPFLVPIDRPDMAKEYVSRIDKLLLAGGQDVSPRFYQTANKVEGAYFEKRDDFELALIDEALKQNKPIFAVCRGMQLLNVFFGGTLKQELEKFSQINHMQNPIPKEVASHQIKTKRKSTLHVIYGKTNQVNSFHHQGIHRLSTEFKGTAYSFDGLIEGIEAKTQRVLGVQWHPDFSFQTSPADQAIFSHFVNKL